MHPSPAAQDQVARQPRGGWLPLVVGVLAGLLAAIPLGFVLMYAYLVVAFTGTAATAFWAPLVGVAVIAAVVGTDILIGWAAARAVRSRRRAPVFG